MGDKNRDKEIYNNSMCKYCINRDNCSRNIFTVNVFKDKTTMYCVKYEYDRPMFEKVI